MSGGHIESSHVEPAVARIEPYLITTTYLLDDFDNVDLGGFFIQSQDDREAARRH
jgi:hypothetical protein